MAMTLIKWTCIKCGTELRIEVPYVGKGSEGWKSQDTCPECVAKDAKTWHADLCVDVTLSDVVTSMGGTVHGAVGRVCGRDKTYWSYSGDSPRQWTADELETHALKLQTGIASTRDGQHSPHSIVRLICPSFAEACEHPVEFMAMYYAAYGIHAKLSEGSEMVALANRLDTIVNAVRAASENFEAK